MNHRSHRDRDPTTHHARRSVGRCDSRHVATPRSRRGSGSRSRKRSGGGSTKRHRGQRGALCCREGCNPTAPQGETRASAQSRGAHHQAPCIAARAASGARGSARSAAEPSAPNESAALDFHQLTPNPWAAAQPLLLASNPANEPGHRWDRSGAHGPAVAAAQDSNYGKNVQ